MKHEMKHAFYIVAMLALGLAGCQKTEENPLPEMPGYALPDVEELPSPEMPGYAPPSAENFPDPNPDSEPQPAEMVPSEGGR